MPPLSSCSSVTQTVPQSSSEKISEDSTTNHFLDSLEDEVVHDDCDFVVEESHSSSKTTSASETSSSPSEKVPLKIVWRNVILFAYLHMAAVYGAYLMCTSAMWQTNVFAIFLYLMSGIGVTAGAHRLWAHRSYKARMPLRILLAFVYTIAFENDIFEWARDHRVHHKYSETDADPHNATRGFFFAHIGWLLCRKHPEVIRKGKAIDTSDLLADPVVRFQRKFYLPLVLLCCFVLPTVSPMYFWGETFFNAFFVSTLFRYCFSLNMTWLVNSAAHMWGQRPYDVTINPRQNAFVVLGAVGEGFHNYHHTFPYDYSSSEYGIKYNMTTAFIDAMALIGLAYDRKTASKNVIKARRIRTGEDMPVMKATEKNGVEQVSKLAHNGIHHESKLVHNGVNGIHHGSKLAQNGVNGIHHESKLAQNGVNGILHESKFAQNGILHETKLVQNGVHKRITQDEVLQNGVQSAIFENGTAQTLLSGLKEE